MGVNIALDGPSGAGKSTIAKMLSEKMGYIYVNTGELYRAIALYMIRAGVDIQNDGQVEENLPQVEVGIEYSDGLQHVILCGEDVTSLLHTPEVSMGASRVSAIPAVRSFLLDMQREFAKKYDTVMDGRDIGTVVLPDCDVKIFLTASAEERANRRFKELQEAGDSSTYEQVLADINQRDYNDTHREIAPLKKADDAVEIDTTNYDLQQSVMIISDTVKKVLEEKQSKQESKTPRRRDTIDFSDVRPVTDPKKVNPIRLFFFGIVRRIIYIIYKIKFKMVYEGLENLPKTGSNIIASNHRSYRDPVFAALRLHVPCSFMAKEELFKGNVLFAWLIRFLGAFPVARGSGDMTVIKEAVARLEMGRNLVIYPEGTRSKDGKLGRGKTGVALIASLAQVPVIPMAISFKGEKLRFREKVIISFGKPIQPEELKLTSSDIRELKAIRGKIMNSIAVMVDENVNKL